MQNSFFQYVLFFILFFLFTGCGGASTGRVAYHTQVQKQERPKWVDGVLPQDTDKYMYGMAIESDRQKAIKAALSDMVAKLGTTIESKYESSDTVVNGEYKNSISKNQIKSQVSKIKINNYKVIKTHRVSYREFAVMVQSDKKKFIKGLKASIEEKKNDLRERLNALKGANVLVRYNTKKRLSKEAKELLSEILIVAEMDKNYNKSEDIKFINRFQKEFLEESKSLKFYISSDKKGIKFAEKVKNYLAAHSFNVVNSKRGSVKIVFKTKEYVRDKIAVITVDIRIYDKNRRIGGKSVIVKEYYRGGSKQSVYKSASIHFEEDMKSMGINKFIGLNLDME